MAVVPLGCIRSNCSTGCVRAGLVAGIRAGGISKLGGFVRNSANECSPNFSDIRCVVRVHFTFSITWIFVWRPSRRGIFEKNAPAYLVGTASWHPDVYGGLRCRSRVNFGFADFVFCKYTLACIHSALLRRPPTTSTTKPDRLTINEFVVIGMISVAKVSQPSLFQQKRLSPHRVATCQVHPNCIRLRLARRTVASQYGRAQQLATNRTSWRATLALRVRSGAHS